MSAPEVSYKQPAQKLQLAIDGNLLRLFIACVTILSLIHISEPTRH